jgi:hypothetical protein
MAVKPQVASIDVGSGYTKAVSHLKTETARVSFPSLVCEAPENIFSEFVGESIKTIHYKGKIWLTGQDVLNYGTEPENTLTDAWAGTDGWMVLMLRALHELDIHHGQVHLVTGVPQAVFRDRAGEIRKMLSGEHKAVVHDVPVAVEIMEARHMVLPQAASGLYYWVAHNKDLQETMTHGGMIAGVDVGTFTTGYAVLEGAAPVPAISGGAEIGMSLVAEKLAQKLYHAYGLYPDAQKAMKHLERRQKVFINGALEDISRLVSESVQEVVKPFLGDLRSVWRGRSGSMAIGVYGGGGEDFYPAIQREFPHAQKVSIQESGGSRFLPSLGMMVFFANANGLIKEVS